VSGIPRPKTPSRLPLRRALFKIRPADAWIFFGHVADLNRAANTIPNPTNLEGKG